jgi:hypothetical protein
MKTWREGLFWKIGNGEKTRIWGDKWVPMPTTFSTQSAPKMLNPDAKVIELIGRDTHAWNNELLENLFFPEEVHAILKVPINSNREDAIIWKETANEFFNVKNAYHAAMRRESCLQASSSCQVGNKEIWGQLWKLQIPNGEKDFLWKACHEILPKKVSLYRRKVIKDVLCLICALEEETCFHILWGCSSARDV